MVAITPDEYDNQEEILLAKTQQTIDSLSLEQQDSVYKALSAFRTIYQGYDEVEAELALELLVYEISGLCSIDVYTATTH